MMNEEAACLGAAILAGVAARIYPNLKEAVSKMVSLKSRVDPNPANERAYDRAYERYRGLYESLVELFAKE